MQTVFSKLTSGVQNFVAEFTPQGGAPCLTLTPGGRQGIGDEFYNDYIISLIHNIFQKLFLILID
jgi:hypothetical protein